MGAVLDGLFFRARSTLRGVIAGHRVVCAPSSSVSSQWKLHEQRHDYDEEVAFIKGFRAALNHWRLQFRIFFYVSCLVGLIQRSANSN